MRPATKIVTKEIWTIGFQAKLRLNPIKVRTYDPAFGVRAVGKVPGIPRRQARHISIYAQESNATTRRLAIMNHGIAADIGKEHADTFRSIQHTAPRADYVLANPPFNDSDTVRRDSAFLQCKAKIEVVSEAKDNFRKDDDVRWQFGVPPKGNANFAWVQHFIHHLAPQGTHR